MEDDKMSKSIDSEQLKILADKIWFLLDEHGIDAEVFNLAVRVSPEFYRSIKENFPDRHELDITVGSGQENWHINLICSPFESPRDAE
jgi:hypothetical protein